MSTLLTRKQDVITDGYGNIWHFCIETHTYGQTSYWHRDDGPAIKYANGYIEWYINGSEVSPTEMPLSLFIAYCKHQYRFLQ